MKNSSIQYLIMFWIVTKIYYVHYFIAMEVEAYQVK